MRIVCDNPHHDAGEGVCVFCVQRRIDEATAPLQDALDRDKTGLAQALAEITAETKARRWIVHGRGSYEWNDDRYRQETGWALDAIEKLATDALTASRKLADEALRSTTERESRKS